MRSGTDSLTHRTLGSAQSSISLGPQASTGAIEIAAARASLGDARGAHTGELVPALPAPVMVSFPAAGARISPATPIDLTFSKPVSEVLGSTRPQLSPSTPGSWREANSHTLVFTPSGLGAALASQLQVQLPRAVAVTTGGSGLRTTSQIEWTVPPGSTLRLHQLLARSRLPAGRHGSRRAPPWRARRARRRGRRSNLPSGSFNWRYPNTPHQLQAMWNPDLATVITKGAVMKFENENDLTVDGVAGPTVWHALLTDAIAGKRLPAATATCTCTAKHRRR